MRKGEALKVLGELNLAAKCREFENGIYSNFQAITYLMRNLLLACWNNGIVVVGNN